MHRRSAGYDVGDAIARSPYASRKRSFRLCVRYGNEKYSSGRRARAKTLSTGRSRLDGGTPQVDGRYRTHGVRWRTVQASRSSAESPNGPVLVVEHQLRFPPLSRTADRGLMLPVGAHASSTAHRTSLRRSQSHHDQPGLSFRYDLIRRRGCAAEQSPVVIVVAHVGRDRHVPGFRGWIAARHRGGSRPQD